MSWVGAISALERVEDLENALVEIRESIQSTLDFDEVVIPSDLLSIIDRVLPEE